MSDWVKNLKSTIRRRSKKIKEMVPLPEGDYISYADLGRSVGLSKSTIEQMVWRRIIPKHREWHKPKLRGKVPRRYAEEFIDCCKKRESVPELRNPLQFRKYSWKRLFLVR